MTFFGYLLTNSFVPKEQFITALMTSYESHIKVEYLFFTELICVQKSMDFTLYLKLMFVLFARKFGIISVPPIGCCPSQRIFNPTGGCLGMVNEFSRAFHSQLATLMLKINSELPGMKSSLETPMK